MNFKKRVNGSWHDIPYYVHNTSADTITTLPADIYANAATATVGLKGQTVQSGTPTPQNPVMPEGTGERTGNLLSEKYENRSINGIGAFTIDSNYDLWLGEVVAGQTYAISNMNYVYGFFTTKPLPNTGATYDSSRGYEISGTAVVTVPSGCTWIAVRVLHSADNAMLNSGSTALPYEPYGYKIPISSANTTTPVYLGEVETTRKVKKLVLDGTESLVNAGGNAPYRLPINDIVISSSTSSIEWYCSHYQSLSINDSWASYDYCISRTSTTAQSLQFRDVTKGNITAFKQYLAAQYAAGTPVTVWYVLTEPTTGIVNEPLRKIGDYADTVSGITIPTIAGANAVDVLTTLKPSEVTATYRGWHPVQSVHKRENGVWD